MAKGLIATAKYGLVFEFDQELVDPINRLEYIKAREAFIDLMANREAWRETLDADRVRFMELFADKNPMLRIRYAAELKPLPTSPPSDKEH